MPSKCLQSPFLTTVLLSFIDTKSTMSKRKADHETEAPVKRRVIELPIPSMNWKEDVSMVKGQKRKDHGECSSIPAKKKKLFEHVPNDREQPSSSMDTMKQDTFPVILKQPTGFGGRVTSDMASTSCRNAAKRLDRAHCPYHPDAYLVEDYSAGDLICTECGLVVVDRCIDVAAEWRVFSSEEDLKDPSRVGDAQNLLLNGGDLTTMISKGAGAASFDEFGNPKYQNRQTMSSSDQSMLNIFEAISTMADRIHLVGIIVDRANRLVKRVYEQKILKGRVNAIASACLFIACREEGVPRSYKDICAVSELSMKEICRCVGLIMRGLQIVLDPIKAEDFTLRFSSNLGLPKEVQKAATFIARKAEELYLVPGRSPVSVAAAAIYMASQASAEKKTRKEIGDMAGVVDVTVRASYQLIYPRAAELFPPDFKFDTPVHKLPQL
ncbi:transcription initiation factor IIB-like isoform X1 [Archocentrus centrarchus]|uniref:transcription initiation factor IIB-like isoform X1 n=2 Tax=Archocentrus centrarchus TaxID=63155 RepID=UPI0011EA1A2A|nr:transcription initiation factor IIB-like isoform X1 [Archocentrus centrarchus]